MQAYRTADSSAWRVCSWRRGIEVHIRMHFGCRGTPRSISPDSFGTAVDARVDLVHGDAWVVYVKEVDSNPTHVWSFRREMMSDVRDVWDERTVGRMVRWVEVHEFCEKC
jgi:hypothetical protein